MDPFLMECPRGLDQPPCEACPLALESINRIKGLGKKDHDNENLPCDWFILNQEFHHCFWVYYKMLDDDPSTDKEICDMLMINKATLEKDFKSAIQKLIANKDREDVKIFIEMIIEKTSEKGIDYGIYMPSQFRDSIKKIVSEKHEETEEEKEGKIKKKKHPTGLPLHRDGKKVDIYSLGSKKKKTNENPKKTKNNKV